MTPSKPYQISDTKNQLKYQSKFKNMGKLWIYSFAIWLFLVLIITLLQPNTITTVSAIFATICLTGFGLLIIHFFLEDILPKNWEQKLEKCCFTCETNECNVEDKMAELYPMYHEIFFTTICSNHTSKDDIEIKRKMDLEIAEEELEHQRKVFLREIGHIKED